LNSITAKVPRCTYAGKVTGLRRDPQRRLLSIGQFGRACPAVPPQEENRLRVDNDKLRRRLRLQLGAEIDGPDRAELITRVADLESLTRQLLAERDARAAEADSAKRRIHDLEDDLTAARESCMGYRYQP
jgi:hypothetical protein